MFNNISILKSKTQRQRGSPLVTIKWSIWEILWTEEYSALGVNGKNWLYFKVYLVVGKSVHYLQIGQRVQFLWWWDYITLRNLGKLLKWFINIFLPGKHWMKSLWGQDSLEILEIGNIENYRYKTSMKLHKTREGKPLAFRIERTFHFKVNVTMETALRAFDPRWPTWSSGLNGTSLCQSVHYYAWHFCLRLM